MKKFKSLYKITISVFLTLSLFSGCDSWKTDLKADIDQESKDYCLFAPGSYWVYQDSATLEIDSTVVVSISYNKSTHANPTISFLWEEYTMKMKNFQKNNTYHNGSYTLTSKYCDKDMVEIGIMKFCLLFESGGGKYHNGEIHDSYGKNATLKLINIQDLYFYSKVKVFQDDYLEERKIFYWAKHIGLIREEIFKKDSLISVRNLIKYNVNPYNQ